MPANTLKAQTKPPAARPPPPTRPESLPPLLALTKTGRTSAPLVIEDKGLQEDAISWLISGGSGLVVFATGAGKSLVYQVAALTFDLYDAACGKEPVNSLTLVISPLLALMKEQVTELQKRNLPVGRLSSDLENIELQKTFEDLEGGKLRILYCSPERFNNFRFMTVIKKLKIRMIAVDEAHCISEWGNTFRPDYLKIAQWASELHAERVLCLTATAPRDIRSSLLNTFNIPMAGLFQSPSTRTNFTLRAVVVQDKVMKDQMVMQFLQSNKGPAIVYVSWRKTAEQLASTLLQAGYNAKPYHAGLDDKHRQTTQQEFQDSTNMVIVATIAFGMGINKANIRSVIHYNMPTSKEAYAQEIGRAGRDNNPVVCQVFLTNMDSIALENVFRARTPSSACIAGFLQHIFEGYESANTNEVLEVSMYILKEYCDIDDNTAAILFSLLELKLRLLSPMSPRHNNYAYRTCSPQLAELHQSGNHEADAIFRTQNVQKIWTHVDVNIASSLGTAVRGNISSLMEQWAYDKKVEINTRKNVIDRFRLLRSAPNSEEMKKIGQQLFIWMQEKETIAIHRMHELHSMLTGKVCFRQSLAEYFDGEDSIHRFPGACCDACTPCTEKASVQCQITNDGTVAIDHKKINAVLSEIPESDAVILARVALGAEVGKARKYDKTDCWGSFTGADFHELVKMFSARQVQDAGRLGSHTSRLAKRQRS
ncbi:P-loop containing nucleoside triphosphate hydrolase protein [Pyronema domesticum]|nr:P-loop containing nucleoside triphosphate hydrolase protein [Pyronema domesticum]